MFPIIAIDCTDYIKIEGDVHVVDFSRTTTNTDSFNRTSTSNVTPPLGPTLSVPRRASSANHASVDSSSNLHDTTIQTEVPLPRRTSTFSSINAENTNPHAPRFNTRFQHTPHPYSNLSTGSLDAPGSLGCTMHFSDTTYTTENWRQHIFSKIKRLFRKFLSYLSTKHFYSRF